MNPQGLSRWHKIIALQKGFDQADHFSRLEVNHAAR
jgi:hypothetical protein